MKRTLLILVTLLLGILLVGCNSTNKDSETEPGEGGSSSSSQGSLHNYTKEALNKALSEQHQFPELNPNQEKTEMVPVDDGNEMKVTYSSDIQANVEGDKVEDLEDGSKKWSGLTEAEWLVTLKKVWHRESKTDVESQWIYKYNPQTDKIEITESDNNDDQLKNK